MKFTLKNYTIWLNILLLSYQLFATKNNVKFNKKLYIFLLNECFLFTAKSKKIMIHESKGNASFMFFNDNSALFNFIPIRNDILQFLLNLVYM